MMRALLAKNASSDRATTTSEDVAMALADHATKYQECYSKLASPP